MFIQCAVRRRRVHHCAAALLLSGSSSTHVTACQACRVSYHVFGGAPQQDPFDAHVGNAEVAECWRWCNMGRDEAIAAYVAEHSVNAHERIRRFKLQAVLDALGVEAFASALPGIAISDNIQVDKAGTALGTMPSKPFRVDVMLRHDIATVLEREQARGAQLLRAGGRAKVHLKDGHAVRRLFCYSATLDEAIAWRDGLHFAAYGRHASLWCFVCQPAYILLQAANEAAWVHSWPGRVLSIHSR